MSTGSKKKRRVDRVTSLEMPPGVWGHLWDHLRSGHVLVRLALCALAATSTNGMVRRLGGKRWQRLHQLVYVAAALGVLHFLWLVKADIRQPATYGLVLVGLLGVRLVLRRAGGEKRPAEHPRGEPITVLEVP